jgi:CPA2 family monovalent cation:H+ antiporter-2
MSAVAAGGQHLIGTLAAAAASALVLGAVASKLRLPAIAGYLLAGVVIGPWALAIGDVGVGNELAEIGVMLLMFGVGLHFSVEKLMAVKGIAVPGAVLQMVVATALGAAVANSFGWSWVAGVVFGLALCVASTVVLVRTMEEQGEAETEVGQIAIGWLLVEDLASVLMLVVLPVLVNGKGDITGAVWQSVTQIMAFVGFMLLVGKHMVPAFLEKARELGHELFTLAVLTTAVGIAVGAAKLFGVSFALGAFFAGIVVSSGSELGEKTAQDLLPLQDVFAVLFFVSVGMLFDPSILWREPVRIMAVLGIVLVGKTLAAFAIVLFFKHKVRTAFVISASLAQVGEFSFILAGLGISLAVLPEEARSLILAAALISIALNGVVFRFATGLHEKVERKETLLVALEHGREKWQQEQRNMSR